ncbi:unnamed protein product, partial [Pylaiella littoralis]
RATGGELPDALANDFCPSNSCLCTRADCFHTFLVGVEKSKATRVCHDCGGAYSGKKKTKWYEIGPEDGSGKGCSQGPTWPATNRGEAVKMRRRNPNPHRSTCPTLWSRNRRLR